MSWQTKRWVTEQTNPSLLPRMLLHHTGMQRLARHQATHARLSQSKSAYQYGEAATCELTMQHQCVNVSRH